MTQIEILSFNKYDSYTEVSYKMRFTLPAIYGTSSNPIKGLNAILNSFPGGGYSTEVTPADGTVITYSKTSPIPLGATVLQIESSLQALYTSIRNALDLATLSPHDTIAGLGFDGATWSQAAAPVSTSLISNFKGRACTFTTLGRAGTSGQKILSLFNDTGSQVTVTINKVFVDLVQTVVKAITVRPPVVRLWKITAPPTNGTVLSKNKIGGTIPSSSSVIVRGDSSADGTGSGTTLTATLPAGAIVTQEFAPRYITGAGYEPADRMEFLGDTTITLNALEGVVLFLDYTLATQNPVTDQWTGGIEWEEK